MRKKEEKESFGVADGFVFDNEIEETPIPERPKKEVPPKSTSTESPEVDPNRCYSKYYTPKPKKGAQGGLLGRGAVSEENRKVQFSLTCTPAQKQRFIEAAEKDHRKLPDFICIAVEEYIKNNNL